MNEALYTFSPNNTADQLSMWTGIVVAAIGFYLCYRFLKQKGTDHNRKMLLAMLFFFAGIIAMSTAFFSGWNLYRQGSVGLYEDAISVGKTHIPFTDIRKMVVREDQGQSFINPQISTRNTRILLIERNDGKTFALSSDRYPLPEILGHLQELREGKGD